MLLLQEFLLAIDVTSSGTPEEKLKWAFRMYDVDGNGVIDIQEMTKIVQVKFKLFSSSLCLYTKSQKPLKNSRKFVVFEGDGDIVGIATNCISDLSEIEEP